jgi:catechol-2,3-dioxygenase
MTPRLDRVDHIHVYVSDREVAEQWYAEVLGLSRLPALAQWAADGGPLTLTNEAGTVHLALFERKPQACRSTIAFGVTALEFIAWRQHLSATLEAPPKTEDHELSWSLYFSDPDGNPYEVTTYEYDAVEGLV